MDVYQTEEQQIELIKNLWKRYGSTLVTGLLIGCAAFYGYKYWNQHVWQQTYQASALFDRMIAEAGNEEPNVADIQSSAELIIQEFDGTPYASMSALMLAKIAIQEDNNAEAEQQLRYAMAHTKDTELKIIAAVRLARVYLAQEKPEQAQQTVETIPGLDRPNVAEVKGDVALANGQTDAAIEAYEAAIAGYKNQQAQEIVTMKLNDIKPA